MYTKKFSLFLFVYLNCYTVLQASVWKDLFTTTKHQAYKLTTNVLRNDKSLNFESDKKFSFNFKWDEYALLDSGEGRKLERFGKYIIDRPDHKAQWDKYLPKKIWKETNASFFDKKSEIGQWHINQANLIEPWITHYHNVTFSGKLTPSGQVGYFPDKTAHWNEIINYLTNSNKEAKVLNLFAYTGVATLIAANIASEVTHVDASKKALLWAKENQKLSRLEHKPIRWIYDDAKKFTQRESLRGKRYDLILLDPPRFGRGPKKEIWDIFQDLIPLLKSCEQILEKKNSLLILNTYSAGLTHAELGKICNSVFKGDNLNISTGQLVLKEEGVRGLVLPQSEFSLVKFK